MMNFYESMESLTSSLHRWVAISWHIKGVRSNDPFKGSIHALEKLVENKKNHLLSCSLPAFCLLLPTRNFVCWAYAFEIFDCLLADELHVNVFVNERTKWKVNYTVPTEFWRALHFCPLESSWAFRICLTHTLTKNFRRSHFWDEF